MEFPRPPRSHPDCRPGATPEARAGIRQAINELRAQRGCLTLRRNFVQFRTGFLAIKPECLAQIGFNRSPQLGPVDQRLPGVFAALADTLALVAAPGAALFQNVVLRA